MPLDDKAHMHFVDSSDIHTLHSMCESSLIPRSPWSVEGGAGYETSVSPTNESSVIGHFECSDAIELQNRI